MRIGGYLNGSANNDNINEGIAVAMQADPVAGNHASMFNGQNVHDACRSYLVANTLPRPLANYVTTTPFRNLPDSTFSYRVAGSFVRFLIDRHGTAAVLEFFRQAGGRDESLTVIRARAERIVTTTEGKYRRLYEGLMDGFAEVTLDGRIREFNEEFRITRFDRL